MHANFTANIHNAILLAFSVSSKSSSTLSDEEVVNIIIKSQSPAMVNVLYERYVEKVYRKCISFVKEGAIAEDLTHDIFIKVYTNLPSFKQRSKFSTWLYSITYNYCIDYLRRHKRERLVAIEEQRGTVKDIEVETAEDLYDIEAKRLKELLEKVKPEEKMILLLKYQEGLSIRDIQQVFKISESAVKMRIKRAKEKIRKQYNQQYKRF